MARSVTRASRVKLMWDQFLTLHLMICAVDEPVLGTQVMTIMMDMCKCLNDSSRALFLKLRASACLKVDGLASTGCCQLEVGLMTAAQLDKFGTASLVSSV